MQTHYLCYIGVISTVKEISIDISSIDSSENLFVENSCSKYLFFESSFSKKIRVKCTKNLELVSPQGVIEAVLNNQITASTSNCLNFVNGFPGVEQYCLSKTFDFDLSNISTRKEYFDIDCRIQEKSISVNTKLYKLCNKR
jgi:hypothetical protein